MKKNKKKVPMWHSLIALILYLAVAGTAWATFKGVQYEMKKNGSKTTR